MPALRVALIIALALAACDGNSHAPPPDAAPPLDADKAALCASAFGMDLAPGFARFDGTVLAVIAPDDQRCAEPNRTHLVVQLAIGPSVYRMVVDVLSNQGSPDVLFDELDAPLAGGAWAEGVHAAASLDYATTLGVHSAAFLAAPQHALVRELFSAIDVGAPISIYATVGDEMDSAHLVHRQGGNTDGAIVIHPDTAPHYLLMRFDEQVF